MPFTKSKTLCAVAVAHRVFLCKIIGIAFKDKAYIYHKLVISVLQNAPRSTWKTSRIDDVVLELVKYKYQRQGDD